MEEVIEIRVSRRAGESNVESQNFCTNRVFTGKVTSYNSIRQAELGAYEQALTIALDQAITRHGTIRDLTGDSKMYFQSIRGN